MIAKMYRWICPDGIVKDAVIRQTADMCKCHRVDCDDEV